MALVFISEKFTPQEFAAIRVRLAATRIAEAVDGAARSISAEGTRVGLPALQAALGPADWAELTAVWPKVKALLTALGKPTDGLAP